MKKLIILYICIVTLILSSCANEKIDISNCEDKYQYTYNNIEDCVLHTDMAVIAEYIEYSTYNQCSFKVKESLYGDDVTEGDLIHVNVPPAPVDQGEIFYSSIPSGNKNSDYRTMLWYKSILLVDLVPGEEYLIIGDCIGTYTYGEYKGYKRCTQEVILYPDYPFTADAFLNGEITNPEDYVSVVEYTKYIDRSFGHGTKEG